MSDIDTSGLMASIKEGSQNQGRKVRPYSGGLKRAMDIWIALMILPVIFPVLAVLWFLARRDGGSGFYGHLRVGRGGRMFRCWKVRTMVQDAETRLVLHLKTDPMAAVEWKQNQKLLKDPRVTPFGRILRQTSLDELPQIWNILRGDMSFVGPRPVTQTELERYGALGRYYLECRPGLTGLWQVNGRGSAPYEERIAFDRRYAETISFGRDMNLIIRTIPVVIRKTGS